MSDNYVIAKYLRLSLDDGVDGDSNSIVGQRDLIDNFLCSHSELKNYNCIEFSDDGYSGTNFKRPGIEYLLKEVKNGHIQCIIVKDFSRFGRNYIEVGEYLEQIFPFLRVRFISVNDGYDSQIQGYNTGDISIGFKHIYNDYYSKDLSHKITSGIRTSWESGKFLSRYPVYGYRKNPENKYQLVKDEKTAPIVRHIFDMALSGCKPSQIAALLNEEKIFTPMEYLAQTQNINTWNNLSNIWTSVKIISIIRDIRYTGILTAGTTVTKELGSKIRYKADKSQWYITENTHEAIVSKGEYEKAQCCIRKIKEYTETRKKSPYSLPIAVRCGGCGRAMDKRNHIKMLGYFCKYKHIVSNADCFAGTIGADIIKNVLLTSIQHLYDIVTEHKKHISIEINPAATDTLKQLQALQKETECLNRHKLDLYNRYRDGELSKDDYFVQRKSADEQIQSIASQVNVLEQENWQSKPETIDNNPLYEVMKDMPYPAQFSNELITALVDCVIVYDETRIEIKWKFSDSVISELLPH